MFQTLTMNGEISNGILHEVPEDLQTALSTDADLVLTWNRLTPIQRNEWICWVTIVKKVETRIEHIQRLVEDVKTGKKNPCCWPGCPHRREKARKFFKSATV